MRKQLALMFLTIATPALAQQIPDDAIKASALKRAYQLSGTSAVSWGMIDVSGENLDANTVKVERIIPLTDPATLNAIDARALKVTEQTEAAPREASWRSGDVCRRHGLRRVTTEGGKSWRCRK